MSSSPQLEPTRLSDDDEVQRSQPGGSSNYDEEEGHLIYYAGLVLKKRCTWLSVLSVPQSRSVNKCLPVPLPRWGGVHAGCRGFCQGGRVYWPGQVSYILICKLSFVCCKNEFDSQHHYKWIVPRANRFLVASAMCLHVHISERGVWQWRLCATSKASVKRPSVRSPSWKRSTPWTMTRVCEWYAGFLEWCIKECIWCFSAMHLYLI